MTYFARKTPCRHGHKHDSATEAKRCNDLHIMQAAGEIAGLQVSERFTFVINGKPVKMGNGQAMRFTADFSYVQDGRKVVEDVKAKNKHMARDVPVKLALARHLWPEIEWRVA